LNNQIPVSGRKLADQLYSEIIHELHENKLDAPRLAIVQLGNNPASNNYIKMKQNKLAELGWYSKHIRLEESVSYEEMAEFLVKLGQNDNFHGIIVQLPLSKHLNIRVLDHIPQHKDVDGLTSINQGMLCKGYDQKDYLVPCTALGCIHYIKANQINLTGVKAAILGRSNLVGFPISVLLQQQGASVAILSQHDKAQQELTKTCDLLISAIGIPNYITSDFIKPGAKVVDIGISSVEDKLCGDVHPEVRTKASWVSPTVGGIGPLTVAFLIYNLLKCAGFCQKHLGIS